VQHGDSTVLRHVAVVLVAPKHGPNVGAVARVCENFEVSSWEFIFCDVHRVYAALRSSASLCSVSKPASLHDLTDDNWDRPKDSYLVLPLISTLCCCFYHCCESHPEINLLLCSACN
jgi:hypothetical protein